MIFKGQAGEWNVQTDRVLEHTTFKSQASFHADLTFGHLIVGWTCSRELDLHVYNHLQVINQTCLCPWLLGDLHWECCFAHESTGQSSSENLT